MIVKATREGLLWRVSASGYVIDDVVYFVALPAKNALFRFVWVAVSGPALSVAKRVYAQVLDVGPWNVADNDYVFGGKRPQAETGTDLFGRKTNGAGIDLGGAVHRELAIVRSEEHTSE